jgi:hypothetical protein
MHDWGDVASDAWAGIFRGAEEGAIRKGFRFGERQ